MLLTERQLATRPLDPRTTHPHSDVADFGSGHYFRGFYAFRESMNRKKKNQ